MLLLLLLYSTIRNADRIVVIREGAIVEIGNHDELMAIDGGEYYEMVKLQSTEDIMSPARATPVSKKYEKEVNDTTNYAANSIGKIFYNYIFQLQLCSYVKL